MGEVPAWFRLIQAARYLGVAPWDLARQPAVWMNWALAAQTAQHEAEAKKKG